MGTCFNIKKKVNIFKQLKASKIQLKTNFENLIKVSIR